MPASPTAELALIFLPEHYPFWSQVQDRLKVVVCLDLFAEPIDSTKPSIAVSQADIPATDMLSKGARRNGLRIGKLDKILRSAPVESFKLSFDDNSVKDLWLAVTWGKE